MKATGFHALAGLACMALIACGGSGEPVAEEEAFVFETGEYDLEPGEEAYECYTMTLDEATAIQRVEYEKSEGVHHMLLARTLAPEPEGHFECDVLLKSTWLPLFGAGNGSTELTLPDDVGFVASEGSQLLIQLHLLNTTGAPITDRVRLHIRETAADSVEPAGVYAFGSTEFELPPRESSEVVSDCEPEQDVDAFAVLPHMHYLGRSLTFEAGPAESSMETRYRLDSWNFDAQFIERRDLHIPAGWQTRTTCEYFNDRDEPVTFGESSHDEMCFFVAFVRDNPGLDGCLTGDVDIDGGDGGDRTCDAEPNEMGIGADCTQGGGECAEGLSCTADLRDRDSGMCVKLGCRNDDECGPDASCCAPSEGGGIRVCLPDACRPAECRMEGG